MSTQRALSEHSESTQREIRVLLESTQRSEHKNKSQYSQSLKYCVLLGFEGTPFDICSQLQLVMSADQCDHSLPPMFMLTQYPGTLWTMIVGIIKHTFFFFNPNFFFSNSKFFLQIQFFFTDSKFFLPIKNSIFFSI